MKVRASVKRICEHCYTHRRRGGDGRMVVRVGCKRNRKHKQRQG